MIFPHYLDLVPVMREKRRLAHFIALFRIRVPC